MLAMKDEQVEEIKRHFGVVAEALRSDLRQIAEGHSGIQREIHELREEFRDEFTEMRALMRLSFSQLDQRIRHSKPTFQPSRPAWIALNPFDPRS